VVVANFSNADYSGYRIGIPQEGDWHEVLNSQDTLYGGSGTVNGGTLTTEPIIYDGFNQSMAIDLSRMAFLVLEKGSEPTAVDDSPPTANRLEPNFPNPFNPTTTIRFSLEGPQHATLRIYDVSGRLIRTLVDTKLPSGRHEVLWNGQNERGEQVASGVYLYRLVLPDFIETQRMVLLR
jgi:hypothetical protein